jgi:hypothetical protein
MPETKRIWVPVREGEIRADTWPHVSVQCLGCKHFLFEGLSCDAFPEGIPREIVEGKFDHSAPYEGDGGIRYEPRE